MPKATHPLFPLVRETAAKIRLTPTQPETETVLWKFAREVADFVLDLPQGRKTTAGEMRELRESWRLKLGDAVYRECLAAARERGGHTVVARRGREYYSELGKKGSKALMERHGREAVMEMLANGRSLRAERVAARIAERERLKREGNP